MFNSRTTRRNLIAAATAVALVSGGVTAPAFAAESGSAPATAPSGSKAHKDGMSGHHDKKSGADKTGTHADDPEAAPADTMPNKDKGSDAHKDMNQGEDAGKDTAPAPNKDKGMGDDATGNDADASDATPTKDPAGTTPTDEPAKTDPAQDGDKDQDADKSADIAVYGVKVPKTSVVDGALTDNGKLAVDKAIKDNKTLGATFDKVFPVLCGLGALASSMDKDFAKKYDEKISESLDGAFGAPKTAEQKVVGAYIVSTFVKKFKAGECEAGDGMSSNMMGAGSSDFKTPLAIVAALAVLAGIANFAMTNPQIAAALRLPGAPMPAPAPAPAK